jgi:hypothetical protein
LSICHFVNAPVTIFDEFKVLHCDLRICAKSVDRMRVLLVHPRRKGEGKLGILINLLMKQQAEEMAG